MPSLREGAGAHWERGTTWYFGGRGEEGAPYRNWGGANVHRSTPAGRHIGTRGELPSTGAGTPG